MTLEQLRIFVAAAHVENFTRAGERLNISQSAVSAAIAALEREFQILLFDRSRRYVALTAAGDLFLAEAEAILARVEQATRRLEDLSAQRVGRISIAASQIAANYWLPSVLNRFRDNNPGIAIDVWHGSAEDVQARIRRGQSDIGVVGCPPEDGTFEVTMLSVDKLIAVVGERHKWYGRDRIEWDELPQTSWIMREPGSGTQALFEAAMVERGIPVKRLDVALVLRTGEAVCNAVANGTSAAVVSNLVAGSALQTGLLHHLQPIAIPREFALISLRDRPETTVAAALRDCMHGLPNAILPQGEPGIAAEGDKQRIMGLAPVRGM